MKVQNLILFFVVGICAHLNAQIATPPAISLENPYNTMYVHLYYLQNDSYEPAKAAKTIYPSVDSLDAVNDAIKLKQILDGKGLYVYLDQVPQQSDYRDSISKQNYYYPFKEQLPGLYLERVNANGIIQKAVLTSFKRCTKRHFHTAQIVLLIYCLKLVRKDFLV